MSMDWRRLLCIDRPRPSEKPAADARTEFERDYDRAVFCTPVRRLQDKAQVFPLEPHDAVRTRLTHSLEVSTLARDLARAVAARLKGEGCLNDDQASALPTIAATAGLIHDLGNPPFGHAGEDAIRSWFASRTEGFFAASERSGRHAQDFLNFEGNAQTIRLVSRLQVLADLHGLNLTYGSLSAACKYVARSDEIDRNRHEFSKPGYFASEERLIEQLRERTGTGQSRNPMTRLVEAADDLIYATVDLEDAVKKGVLDYRTLKEKIRDECNEDRSLADQVFEQSEKYLKRSPLPLPARMRDDALAQAFRIFTIIRSVPAVLEAFHAHYAQIMAGEFHGELVEKSAARSLIGACKRLARQCVYCADEVIRLEVMGTRVIQDLLALFWNAASTCGEAAKPHDRNGKLYHLMSSNYRIVFEEGLRQGALPDLYLRCQLLTDYICGMTDSFACSLHRRLLNG